MIKEMLKAAGILYPEKGRFLRLPEETFADIFDDIDTDGVDPVPGLAAAGLGRIYTHNARIEVYEALPDATKKEALEAELDTRGLNWSKTDTVWLDGPQRYQTVYEFIYTNKRRN